MDLLEQLEKQEQDVTIQNLNVKFEKLRKKIKMSSGLSDEIKAIDLKLLNYVMKKRKEYFQKPYKIFRSEDTTLEIGSFRWSKPQYFDTLTLGALLFTIFGSKIYNFEEESVSINDALVHDFLLSDSVPKNEK